MRPGSSVSPGSAIVSASPGARTPDAGPTAAMLSPCTSTTQPARVSSLVASKTRSGRSRTGRPGGEGTSGANPARAGSLSAESNVSVDCAGTATGTAAASAKNAMLRLDLRFIVPIYQGPRLRGAGLVANRGPLHPTG